jgi:hypothetical protein
MISLGVSDPGSLYHNPDTDQGVISTKSSELNFLDKDAINFILDFYELRLYCTPSVYHLAELNTYIF